MVTLLLLVLMIVAAYLQRGLVFEQKASTHQYRATQAAESAEAGLEWGLAMLNAPRLDDHCAAQSTGRPLRDRVLVTAGASRSAFQPVFDPSAVGAPACARSQGGWQCLCPSQGLAVPGTDADDELHPGFRIEFSGAAADDGHPLPGVVRLVAHGCAHAAQPFCADGRPTNPGHAVASVQAALVPALAAVPPAALTASGDIDFASNAVSVHNPDRASGWLLQAGGALKVAVARLFPPSGTPASSALSDHDPVLAARSAEDLQRLHLGMTAKAYAQLPSVAALSCASGCKAAMQTALSAGYRMLYVNGDLQLDNIGIGSAQEPVVLLVDGAVRFGAGVRFAGFLMGGPLQWQGSGADALRGAAVIAGSVSVTGTPDFTHDAAVLDLLHTTTGTFARVPGSWKDTP